MCCCSRLARVHLISSRASPKANWLVLHDDNNRVLIYSIKDGELRHRFFGANAAMNPSRNQVIVENYPGELTFMI